MSNSRFLIIGNGHLAHRTMLLLKNQKKEVDFQPNLFLEILSNNRTKIDDFAELLESIQIDSFTIVYILFEDDNQNLETVIALNTLYPKIQIATALFNEKLIPHLKLAIPKIEIFNPARISAGEFVKGIYDTTEIVHSTIFTIDKASLPKINKPSTLLISLVAAFILLITFTTVYFHYFENLKWLDSFYFVIVTVTSVGYGDFSLLSSNDLSKIVGIILMLSSSIFIWLILSLLIDNLSKRKTERALGRKKYNYSNHIILCGLGRLGFFVAQELITRGEKIIIIETNENSVYIDHFRRSQIDVYIGNAIQHEVLLDVGVGKCKALIAVTNDDYSNLEIGLTARSYQEKIILVLRIFDEVMAESVNTKFNIQHSKSMSFIAAQKLAELADNKSH
jgi:Trk K+ transport system NAD-binding subunit